MIYYPKIIANCLFKSLLLSGLLLTLSCQQISPDQLFTRLLSRRWQLCCRTIMPPICLPNHPKPLTDLQAIRPSCDQDDIVQFMANAHWQITEGDSICTPRTDTLIAQGSWLLAINADSLILHQMNMEGDGSLYQIIHLDSLHMVRRYNHEYSNKLYMITELFQATDQ